LIIAPSAQRLLNVVLIQFACVSLTLSTVGCSGKLSRSQAKRMISDKVSPNFVQPARGVGSEPVPGFTLPQDDYDSEAIFHVEEHKEYGPLTFQKDESPDEEDYLDTALARLGYISLQENGPMSRVSSGIKLDYSHSRTVQLTNQIGSIKNTGYSREYSSGFSCYPAPQFDQCNTPPLIEMLGSFTITGIVQDEIHAQVNILIDWRLTAFGLQLKPFAAQVAESEKRFGDDSKYESYPALYSWAHFLNEHPNSGSSPAKILFQKFDDGWRIVDSNGKSEKDYQK